MDDFIAAGAWLHQLLLNLISVSSPLSSFLNYQIIKISMIPGIAVLSTRKQTVDIDCAFLV